MSALKVKRCPFCDGEPQFVHYMFGDDDGRDSYFLVKRIECKECGASVNALTLTLEGAIEYWNMEKSGERVNVLKRWGVERCRNVEGRNDG